ncbi:Card1-like endonuclease domain-containing protein [Nitratidesulfovibrio liaohensis]|uniref:Card1-like endonuclease domain-containing protein n=1 Tax=Nitratidesulfovibrio liaohensis TaxID=2604158 RepID=UPI0014243659|nr:DUF1887 family CARF protein [Nitratidesulfovibrio liaohensis]NHZ45125.1 DUF1887 family protein [Nitratidesulfovibrio liaohensis]
MSQPLLYCCLASEQPEPNLIPVLMPGHKPDKAVVLLTPEMRNRPTVLGLLSELGRHCNEVETQETAAFDYPRIVADMQNVMARHSGWAIHCNMTGGTKVMSVAVSEACRTGGGTCLYVDTANRSCLHLGMEPVAEPLPSVLDVSTIFRLRGYNVGGVVPIEQDPPGVYGLVMWMGRNAPNLQHAVGQLHWIAGQGEGDRLVPSLVEMRPRDHEFSELWSRVCKSGLVSANGRTLTHPSARRILTGSWLERYVYHVVRELPENAAVSSILTGVNISTQNGTSNEIDVCFTAANRLHLVECKARPVERMAQDAQAGITYKLDSLRDIMAGTFGRAMFVTSGEIKSGHRGRCRDLRIAHSDNAHLPSLPDAMSRWIAPR